MTYDAYAMFAEGSYHIAHGNCQEAVLNLAERVCKQMGVQPNGFIAGRRGELKLNCELFELEDLKQRG
jgi:hypothetical protein